MGAFVKCHYLQRPISVPTIDRPRPLEGRINRSLTPKPNPQIGYRKAEINKNYSRYLNDPCNFSLFKQFTLFFITKFFLHSTRKLTLAEREEDRLLNGGKYINLPKNYKNDNQERNFQRVSSIENRFAEQKNK